MKKTTILFILLASSFLLIQASDQAQQELKEAGKGTTNETLPKGVEIDTEGYEFGPKVDCNVDNYNQGCDYNKLNDPSSKLYATKDGQLNKQELEQLEQAAQQATNAQDNDSDDEGDLPMSYTIGGNFKKPEKPENKLVATREQVFGKGYTQAPALSQVRTSYNSL